MSSPDEPVPEEAPVATSKQTSSVENAKKNQTVVPAVSSDSEDSSDKNVQVSTETDRSVAESDATIDNVPDSNNAADVVSNVVDSTSVAPDEKVPPENEKVTDTDLFGSDSDSDIETEKKVKSSLDSEKGENIEEGTKSMQMKELFGSDSDDDDMEKQNTFETGGIKMGSSKKNEIKAGQVLVTLDIPRPSRNVSLQTFKLPPFLAADPVRFDAEEYVEADESNRLKARNKSLAKEHIIRWQRIQKENGDENIQSNSRIVQWEDGSYTLVLGGRGVDDAFSLQVTDERKANHYIYSQQEVKLGDSSETLLQCHGMVTDKLTFMPLAKKSRVHQNLTLNTRKLHERSGKIKLMALTEDSERARDIKIQAQELQARQAERARKRAMENSRSGWNADYLEDGQGSSRDRQRRRVRSAEDGDSSDDGEGETSIARLKGKFGKHGGKNRRKRKLDNSGSPPNKWEKKPVEDLSTSLNTTKEIADSNVVESTETSQGIVGKLTMSDSDSDDNVEDSHVAKRARTSRRVVDDDSD